MNAGKCRGVLSDKVREFIEHNKTTLDECNIDNIICTCDNEPCAATSTTIQKITFFPLKRYNNAQDVWGPCVWKLIHMVANKLPTYFPTLLNTLPIWLPCEECRKNSVDEISKVREEAGVPSEHAFKLHNLVNERLKKTVYKEAPRLPHFTEDFRKKVMQSFECQVRFLGNIEDVLTPLSETTISGEDWLLLQICRVFVEMLLDKLSLFTFGASSRSLPIL